MQFIRFGHVASKALVHLSKNEAVKLFSVHIW